MASARKDNKPTSDRRSANYQPSIWSHNFMESLSLNNYADGLYEERIMKKLVERVKSMIDDDDAEPLALLELIHDIERLGLGYRFKENIRKALERIFYLKKHHLRMENGLHATALSFRLLRQNGFEVSQDVFERFKDQNGSFLTGVGEDVQGMLDLFESSYLAFEGENLLVEAREFTSLYLKNLKSMEANISIEVSHATLMPWSCHCTTGMLRIESRWYIETYEKREDANHLLLELAKQDFNVVQSIHQRDLQDMSKWWRGTGLANNLSFARDRLMECFIWTVGLVFEPQFSKCRRELTKVASILTVLDDIYDVYGSLDELELFTEAVERWDIGDIDDVSSLPKYMKLCFQALYHTVNEIANDTPKKHGLATISYLRKGWADICKAFIKEAKWCYMKQIPSLKEYLDNAWLTSSAALILVHFYFLVSQNISEETLECLENYDDFLRHPSMIFRLCNDLATSRIELERGETTNSVTCCMHEFGYSEELARDYISKMIDETWKKINKYRLADCPFPKPLIEASINLSRTAQCFYQHGDALGTQNAQSKKIVMSLFVEPLSLASCT